MMPSLLGEASTSAATKTSFSAKSSSSSSLCQECHEESFRYQCPRCSLRTCSLQCCQAHKKRTDCDGKRDRTKFLRVCRMNDATLTSDFHFLEDALQGIERSKRSVQGGAVPNNNHNNKRGKRNHPNNNEASTAPHSMLEQMENFEISGKNKASVSNTTPANNTDMDAQNEISPNGAGDTNNPNMHIRKHQPVAPRGGGVALAHQNAGGAGPQLAPKWRNFQHQASLRGTNLLLMPSGMQRRKANTSHIKHNVLHWKIDVRLHPAAASATKASGVSPKLHSMKVCEEAILCQELQNRLSNSWRPTSLSSPPSATTQTSNSSFTEATATTDTNTDTMPVVEEERIHWLMQKLPCPSNRHSYIEIVDQNATLQSLLKGRTIIEYPTLECVPASRLGEFPRAIEEMPPATTAKEATAAI